MANPTHRKQHSVNILIYIIEIYSTISLKIVLFIKNVIFFKDAFPAGKLI